MRVVVGALMFVLAACGGGGSTSESPGSPGTTGTGATSSPTAAALKGTPVPEALSRFRCEKDADGRWNASGVLSNESKAKVTYQVTVYIGPATGGQEQARTSQVPSVAAGGSTKFQLKRIPAAADDGPCYVQVLAVP